MVRVGSRVVMFVVLWLVVMVCVVLLCFVVVEDVENEGEVVIW